MTNATTPRIAVLGAGHVGPAIARLALDAGYRVAIATSGDPGDLALITQLLIPGAEPRWAADAIAGADIVVLAMPLHRFLAMDPTALSGKLVIDAMNYWPPTDGRLPPPFDDESIGSSEVVAERLRDATVVKTLNHIGYHELETLRPPPGSAGSARARRRRRRPRRGSHGQRIHRPHRLRRRPARTAQRRPGAATRRSGVRRSAAPRGLRACGPQPHRTAEGVPPRRTALRAERLT